MMQKNTLEFWKHIETLKCTMEGPKQMHKPHHNQLTAERAKRSHNRGTAG